MSRMPPAFDLVIFDCDGVLVDSEVMTARILRQLLSEYGIEMDDATFRSDFLGRSLPGALKRLSLRINFALPDDLPAIYAERLLPAFEQSLQPMPGVVDVLQRMAVPYCVASSSDPRRLATSLQCSNLAHWFGARVFSGAMVQHAKPAPDLFFYAAERMSTAIERCLVIEDSEIGMQAARAANMQCWHFRGGSHLRHLPPSDASDVASDMRQLLDMFVANGLCVMREGDMRRGPQT